MVITFKEITNKMRGVTVTLSLVLIVTITTGMDQEECGCCPKPCCCTCVPQTYAEDKLHPKCNAELDLCFIVDSTGSIFPDDWQDVLQFLKDIVNSFVKIGQDGTRVATVLYSTNATLQWSLNSPSTSSRSSLLEAIDNLPLIGAFTEIVAAIELAGTEVFTPDQDRPKAPNVCIFTTDGRMSFRQHEFEGVVTKLQTIAHVVSLGVTKEILLDDLQTIATGPGNSNVLLAKEFSDLPSLVPSIIKLICPFIVKEEKCFCCCPPPPSIHGNPGRDVYSNHYKKF